MDCKILEAVESDYEDLLELYGQFVEQPSRYINKDNDSFKVIMSSADTHLLVAKNDKAIIGFIAFSMRNVFRYQEPIIEVEELFVLPNQRRTGLGKDLMQKVEEFAKKNNAYYIFLASDKDRSEAHDFYRSIGYDEYGYHYRKKVGNKTG